VHLLILISAFSAAGIYLFASDYAHDWMMTHSIIYAFFGLFFAAIVLSD